MNVDDRSPSISCEQRSFCNFLRGYWQLRMLLSSRNIPGYGTGNDCLGHVRFRVEIFVPLPLARRRLKGVASWIPRSTGALKP